eukprot:TRINITY_DN799_c0_g1_i4.p1 TRINITY_DN799_c0_g1~~TRINITY_DN799_c0_g1_i4.p1  ORF type:complete len:912 (-),score=186.10 TRINITY_DN799_c0_g1_i4:38-2773(-)
MCIRDSPYIEHEILTYFGFTIPNFEIIRFRFCDDYLTRRDALNQTYCKKLTYCSGYNLTFNQWMYANIIQGKTYKDITLKPVYGLFEFPLFQKEFLNKLHPDYKNQFANVKWAESGLHYLLDTFYEFPDYKTDEASMLLFDNMKRLFEAGKLTHNPFKISNDDVKSSELDLTKFEHIATKLKLTKEQAFMMYCYFDYFVNNTVLLQQFGGTIEKERIANYGAHSLWDIASYCYDYLDVLLYSRALRNRNPTKTCEESVKYYFTINETEGIMEQLEKALCNNYYFDTDLTHPVGWKYFIEANAFPYKYYYHRLFNYLNRTIQGFTNETFDAMLFKAHSPYWTTLEDIKKKAKIHYQTVSKGKACENDFSPFCTKRQMFMDQFFDSIITQFPFPEAHLQASSTIADWWILIKPYMDWTLNSPNKPPQLRDPTPLPDQEIEVPIEFTFLKRYYGRTDINKIDLYNCLHGYGLYDTDFIYNVFLNLRDPSKLNMCQKFASSFFFNSTRYLVRNVEFGPLFDLLKPEDIYFGYFNYYIEVEHILVDYLNGDDCTLNPWIGYNPNSWDHNDKTFMDMRNPSVMGTGSVYNNEIRKYRALNGKSSISYRKRVVDETGDQCPYEQRNPFLEQVDVSYSTDGLQFDQHPGKTPEGDTKFILDSFGRRPVKIFRPNNFDYKYRGIDVVNDYVIDYQPTFGCEKGVHLRNSLDMTSFFQVKSVLTRAHLSDIEEPGLVFPDINFTRPLDLEKPPQGIRPNDSYFIVEPFTGITLKFEKKLMNSIILYYDELYDKISPKALGEILPYYSIYEIYKVHDMFVDGMEARIKEAVNARYATMVTFTVIGFIFVFVALGMIARSFFFKPTVCASQPKPAIAATTSEKSPLIESANVAIEENKAQQVEQEDLQKDIQEVKDVPQPAIN